MYESITYEQLLARMLEYVQEHNQNIDTREGSVVWYAGAPAALEMKQLYTALDTILTETFADTASRPYLIKRAAERGVYPYAATKAEVRGDFTPKTLEIPLGSRFSLGELHYRVIELLEPGAYRLECETAGTAGNNIYGTLIPVEYIAGLETAALTMPIREGVDEEPTEHLRQRYFASLKAEAFGGNVQDYKEKVGGLKGVGGVRVYRAWNRDIHPAELVPSLTVQNELAGLALKEETRNWLNLLVEAARDGLLTVGGTVRVVIQSASFGVPTETLVADVQEKVDPELNHGEGFGTAPLGHMVTVRGVAPATVDIEADISYASGWAWDSLKPLAEAAIDAYFKELAEGWEETNDPLVVRTSYVENCLLNLAGVLDIANTKLNGEEGNLTLAQDHLPVRGDLHG